MTIYSGAVPALAATYLVNAPSSVTVRAGEFAATVQVSVDDPSVSTMLQGHAAEGISLSLNPPGGTGSYNSTMWF